MSGIWELVHQGDGYLAKTWDTPPVPVCRACRKKKPEHRKDCPIAALLADKEALVRLSRELISGGEWHKYQLENDLKEYQALSQELRKEIEDAK